MKELREGPPSVPYWAIYPRPAQLGGVLPFQPEATIEWMRDPAHLDYVRQVAIQLPRRSQPPSRRRIASSLPSGAVVYGYSTVPPRTKGRSAGEFVRRVFYLKPYDRQPNPQPDRSNNGFWYYASHPFEAVDPSTLAPNDLGLVTVRCHGDATAITQWLEIRLSMVRGNRIEWPKPGATQ